MKKKICGTQPKTFHQRGFISLEKNFRKMIKNFPTFDGLFLDEKMPIKTKRSVMYATHAAASVSI